MNLWRSILCMVTGLIYSCGKEHPDDPVVSVNDEQLFAQSKSAYYFYQSKSDTLAVHPGSPHGGFVRIKFNNVARNLLGSDGKLPIGGMFVDSSVVVAEVYQAKGVAADRLAIMMKLKNASNGSGGWVWGEYRPDGTMITSAASKGGVCSSCHSAQGNRDMVRIFEY